MDDSSSFLADSVIWYNLKKGSFSRRNLLDESSSAIVHSAFIFKIHRFTRTNDGSYRQLQDELARLTCLALNGGDNPALPSPLFFLFLEFCFDLIQSIFEVSILFLEFLDTLLQ